MDPRRLRSAVVARVGEDVCHVFAGGGLGIARYAPQFPTPHVERVSPGNRVALAAAADGDVVMWRWYDALVLGRDGENVLLWEPAHGEVSARLRTPRDVEPGSRVYASAGLPGAEWWAAGPAMTGDADVELDEVEQLYDEYGLWDAALNG